ncbi:MAG: vWA domain-containing protein [Myxococcota bacterium]
MSVVACAPGGAPGGEGGAGGGEEGGAASGGTGSSGSTSDGTPSEPQPWVEILEPGQSMEDEARDADGWCATSEGAIPCDDGAEPGSGGDPPPGYASSTSGGGNNGSTSGGPGTSSGGNNGSTSGGPGSSSGGNGSSNGGPVACTNETFTTGQTVKPQMLLVVDKSGSMDGVPDGQNQSKWEQVVSVLETVTAQLEARIDFGLSLFPGGGDNSCDSGVVRVQVGANRADQIANTLNDFSPGGGTPTAPSLLGALGYLRNLDSSRPRAVVLATDGAPNCSEGYNPNTCTCTNGNAQCDDSRNCLDRDGAVSAVEQLAAEGISTFVVGIPGTEGYASVLNEMAVAAGTALPPGGDRYYATTDAQSLKNAMDAIGIRVSECRFTLSQNVDANQGVSVTVDGVMVTRDPSHLGGYDVTSGGSTVEFFGAQCDALADGGSHAITVAYCYQQGG